MCCIVQDREKNPSQAAKQLAQGPKQQIASFLYILKRSTFKNCVIRTPKPSVHTKKEHLQKLCYTHTKAKWCEHTNKLRGSSLKISSLTLDAHNQRTHHLAARHCCVTFGRSGSTSTKSCAASTHLQGAAALPQLCHAPQLLFLLAASALHQLCHVPQLLTPGHNVSTPTLSCAASTHHPAARALHQLRRAPRLLISRSHGFYINYVVRRDYSSPGRTGSTSTLPCAVVPLDFSSVGRTGPRRAPSHYVSRCDYSSSGLHQLYCAYAVHPDVPSRRSTSRRSVALAPAVRPVTASRGATTRRPACTSSTAPMPCIRTRRLAARLLVGRSH
jgi:hypothetical protein